ncbi:MAG: 2-polyprenylphenol 6-hydroxylase [Sphingomonadaceae bacterium]
MTSTAVHVWRFLKWGRILARNGALLGIERDVNTPVALKRIARIARFGSSPPSPPNYAGAFEKIGPAAVKLGQTLATRPDLVGEEAARDLTRLQDSLPALPYAHIKAAIERSLGRATETLFASIDPEPVGAASIAQVHKAVTTEGKTVAVKVLRPGIEEKFASDIQTYEWIAAHAAARGGELSRLRPREVIAQFKQWTVRELDLRREAAAASELKAMMEGDAGYFVPDIDWQRSAKRVMTLEWIDGIKLTNHEALAAAGFDRRVLATNLVRAFLRQAIAEGFFHADLHQGNLFAMEGGRIGAIDFGIMGRVNRQARLWLAEILHGLITGNYRRVAEIHFDAQYVPSHHNIDEFTTALRSVGEPIRGVAVKDISVGNMLDGLFSITREFDMPTQPHLLLLQKTMVMVEGVASSLDPEINLWDVAGPFVSDWIRGELGPEAVIATQLHRAVKTLADLPALVRRIEASYPKPGAAPIGPPIAEIKVGVGSGWRFGAVAVLAAAITAGGIWFFG